MDTPPKRPLPFTDEDREAFFKGVPDEHYAATVDAWQFVTDNYSENLQEWRDNIAEYTAQCNQKQLKAVEKLLAQLKPIPKGQTLFSITQSATILGITKGTMSAFTRKYEYLEPIVRNSSKDVKLHREQLDLYLQVNLGKFSHEEAIERWKILKNTLKV